jgi:hypothetical protein
LYAAGTGKTTTARKIGQVYYDLGFLSQVEVVECSATDLIGQHVGTTGPKTIKQLERGLGKVLFVDEAYRLGEGMFAQEAVNELVDTMTKPKFAGKLVIILAGYDNDMNNLLRVNEGLSSRFADEIEFPSLTPEHCVQLLEERLKQNNTSVLALNDPAHAPQFLSAILELSQLPAWGNARDIQTLAKSMVRLAYQTHAVATSQLVLSSEQAMICMQTMLSSRRARNDATPKALPHFSEQFQTINDPRQPPSATFSTSTTARTVPEPQTTLGEESTPIEKETPRDAGVSDATWTQLQKDKKAAEHHARQIEEALGAREQECRLAEEAEQKRAAETAALRAIQAKNETEAYELGRKREEARIRELEAKAERERIQEELETQRQVEMERKRVEQQAQTKLRQMGVCPAGYRWTKQSGGYRCSAGGHWVNDRQLGL